MRKYAMYLFVFVLGFLGLFNVSINSANAANCAPGDLFNTVTGQACAATIVPAECKPGDLFNSTTGKPCSGTSKNNSSNSVSKFNDLLRSNFKVGVRGNDVKALQQFLKDKSYYFGKVDGKYGKITARAVKDFQDNNNIAVVEKKVCENGASNYPHCNADLGDLGSIISGISGPQSLNVNQQGTWTVKTFGYDVKGGNLLYSVDWGDVSYIPEQFHAVTQQSATFTHSYSQVGTYTPIFTVTSEKGKTEQKNIAVKVGNNSL